MAVRPSTPENLKPRLGAAQVRLLERLSNACAVSGDESEVRSIVLEQVRPYADEVKVDTLGNVLATRRATGEARLRVLLAAHMDEVGFMLVSEEGEGLFRFEPVGGIDERQLVGKPVWVGRDRVPGIIGAKPIHLTTPEERKRAVPLESLRIDLGPGGSARAKAGDRAVFATTFARLGPSLRGKALDDRLGTVLLVELLKNAPAGLEICAAFTVQEEVGLRGAHVAAYACNPDLALALDATPAFDLPLWDRSETAESEYYNTRLDAGPAIYLADGGLLADPRLARFLMDTAELEGIPYQIRQPGGGSTDAAAMHMARAGIPSIAVSVPLRYAHTAAGLARFADWQNTYALLRAALGRLDPSLLQNERRTLERP